MNEGTVEKIGARLISWTEPDIAFCRPCGAKLRLRLELREKE